MRARFIQAAVGLAFGIAFVLLLLGFAAVFLAVFLYRVLVVRTLGLGAVFCAGGGYG